MTTHDSESTINLDKQQCIDLACGMEVDPSAPAATLLHAGTKLPAQMQRG